MGCTGLKPDAVIYLESCPGRESPQGRGIVCTKCLSLPEACSSPGLCPQLAGGCSLSTGRERGHCQTPSIRMSWGHCRHRWPRALPAAQVLRDKRWLLLVSYSMILPGHSPVPASVPINITALVTYPKAQTSSPHWQPKHVRIAWSGCWRDHSNDNLHQLNLPSVGHCTRCEKSGRLPGTSRQSLALGAWLEKCVTFSRYVICGASIALTLKKKKKELFVRDIGEK